MAKKSEIIGEFIITINDNNSIEVSRIYKSTKQALKEIWENAGFKHPEKEWNTQEYGRNILKELCGGAREGIVGEYKIEREQNNRINLIRTYKNAKEGLREVAKVLKFTPDPNEQGWNTQRYGRILVDYAESGKMPPLKEAKPAEEAATASDYPTYEEYVAKYLVGPKGDRYKISEDGKTMYDISESLEGPLVVPEGVEIVKFDSNARIEGLTAIVMPDSVKEMKGWLNGSYCENLKDMRLAPGLKFGNSAFESLHMEELTLPDGIRMIPSDAFEYAELKRITLPASLEFILPGAFSRCSLEEVVVPANVKVIFSNAFERNDDLKKVTFLSPDTRVMKGAFTDCDSIDEETICAERPLGDFTCGQDELMYGDVEQKNWRDEVTGIRRELVYIPAYYCGPLYIEEGTQAYGDIEDMAGITEIHIPDSIEENYPKIPVNVRKVRFPAHIKDINLTNRPCLEEFNWPASAKEIQISDAPIEKLVIPEGIERVSVDSMPQLSEISLPSSLEQVYVCRCPKLPKCELPAKPLELDNGCFSDCPALEEIIIPDGVGKIPYRFAVGGYAGDSSLRSIRIPDSVEIIDEYAFSEHRELKKVVIPASVKTINPYAFSKCSNLTEVVMEGAPLVLPHAFDGAPGYDGPFVELATVLRTDEGLPFLKLTVDQIFFKKNWFDNAFEFVDNDADFGSCVAWQSLSADQAEYPLDKTGFLNWGDNTAQALEGFHDEDEDACDSMLGRGYYMVAHPDDDSDIDFGYEIMDKTADALALILDPEAGRTHEDHPYEGPEAVVELNIRDFGEDEILHTYRCHLLEKDGEWTAEKID